MLRLRAIARTVLGVAGSLKVDDKDSVSSLVASLEDEDLHVRAAAATGLGKLGARCWLSAEEASSVAEALVTALGDSEVVVRETAVCAARCLGVKMVEHIGSIAAALQTERECVVRVALATCLGDFGSAAAPYIGVLVDALADPNWQVRLSAMSAIHAIGSPSAELVEECTNCIRDSSWHVRCATAQTLGTLGPHGEKALIVLLEEDPDWRVRLAAAHEIGYLGESATAEGASSLAGSLNDACSLVSVTAARALGNVGDLAALHVADLVEHLESDHVAMRLAVRFALHRATSAYRFELVGKIRDITARCEDTSVIGVTSWSIPVMPFVLKCVSGLLSKDATLVNHAEECLRNLGAIATPLMAEFVIQAKGGERISAMRGLSCTGALPTDVVCSFLAEWIYTPDSDSLPICGLTLLHLQRPQEHKGQHLQWALLRGSHGKCFLVFRGSETLLDWIENSFASLRAIEIPQWGSLLLHNGFWSAVEGDCSRLHAVLEKASKQQPIDDLVLCGGSKGGANALAAAVNFILPTSHRFQRLFKSLVVIVFGTPNIVGNGGHEDQYSNALQELRAAIKRCAPLSRSWLFKEDPVVAIASSRSDQVVSQYAENAGTAVRLFRWFRPDAYNRYTKYFEDVVDLARTLEPILPEEQLPFPSAVLSQEDTFDISIHPQLNYTEALCKRLLLPIRPKKALECRSFTSLGYCQRSSSCEYAHGQKELTEVMQYNAYVENLATRCGSRRQTFNVRMGNPYSEFYP